MDQFRAEVKELKIGQKIRKLRQAKRQTLQNLSATTGLSKPLLSQIENEQVIPPLATLLRISKALKIPLNNFFQDEESENKYVVVRAGERGDDSWRPPHSGKHQPYIYQPLGKGKDNRSFEPFLLEIEPRPGDEDVLVYHEGEEFIFLLEGTLNVYYKEEVVTLLPGDSIYFDSDEPHGFLATGDVPARGVLIYADLEDKI